MRLKTLEKTNKVVVPRRNKVKDMNKKIEFYTKEEMDEIANILKDEIELYTFTMLLRYTGARIGEAVALNVNDIDFENKTILINKAQKRIPKKDSNVGHTYTIGATKNGVIRKVPLRDDLALQLKKYIEVTEEIEKLSKFRSELGGRLFINPYTKEETPGKITAKIRDRLKKVECEVKYGNHKYRHTFATDLVSRNLQIIGVANLLGHTDVNTTLKYYVGLSEEIKQKGVEIVNTL